MEGAEGDLGGDAAMSIHPPGFQMKTPCQRAKGAGGVFMVLG